jgi:hypothetical protein
VITPAEAMRRLQNAAESGELDVFCRRHAVRVLTVFGSAGRGEEHPGTSTSGSSSSRTRSSTSSRRSPTSSSWPAPTPSTSRT